MREIISLHVGQCGGRIGEKFWEGICDEHDIDKATGQLSNPSEGNANILFREGKGGRHVPRAVFADTDAECIDVLRTGGNCRYLFSPENSITAGSSTGNNWGKGYYESDALTEQVLDCIRLESERCDCLSGFQLTHSIAGGTGSGASSKVCENLRENFPAKLYTSYSVIPDDTTTIATHPYNAVFSIHRLVEDFDMCVLLNNSALSRSCERNLRIQKPSFSHLNNLIGSVMSDCCAPQRFRGPMGSCDWRKMLVNLVPFPRLHFFSASWMPQLSDNDKPYAGLSGAELLRAAHDRRYLTMEIQPTHGRYLTTALMCRGDFSSYDVECFIPAAAVTNRFAEWIPGNTVKTITQTPPPNVDRSLCLLGSSTSIQETFKQISEQFTAMFRRKAHLHHYINIGMDEMEFTEAESNCNDLVSEYQGGDYCHCCIDESWDEEWDEEE
eukprot:TRINITY_DN1496_c0_g1_i1.p1 TRINITY_DN1496_c0_g1~~TRINITY_DN1496_c0_g1_i1.p1  ORF type:complete len:441 (+),score=54.49 TRINITY_DN1496_c0_g1_i1:100-1422(+)